MGVVVEDLDGREVVRPQRRPRRSSATTRPTRCPRRGPAAARPRPRGRAGQQDMLDLARPDAAVTRLTRAAAAAGGVVAVLVEDRPSARRLDAVKRDFVANVSHELRTPVGAIGRADRDAGRRDRPDGGRAASRATSRARWQRAKRLIDEPARLQPRRGRLRRRWRSRRPGRGRDRGARSASRRRRTSAGSGSTGRRPRRRRCSSRASRPQLLSAVSNLLDNAVKYTDAGGGGRGRRGPGGRRPPR